MRKKEKQSNGYFLQPSRPLHVICIEEGMMRMYQGLMTCRIADFDPSKYKGLHYNTRKLRRLTK